MRSVAGTSTDTLLSVAAGYALTVLPRAASPDAQT